MSELGERGHYWLLLCCFAHRCGDGMHPQKGKGECPGTLASRSPKGPVPAVLKARARQAAEMGVSGRPSSPLLPPHPCAAEGWGRLSGWGRFNPKS